MSFAGRILSLRPVKWFQDRYLVKAIRQNLGVFITVVLVASTAVMMLLLSVFVSSHIRDGLFQSRLDQIISDASVRRAAVQTVLDQSNVTDGGELQDVAYQLMQDQREGAAGAGAVGVMLLRSPQEASSVRINEVVDTSLQGVLTPQMRAEVAADSTAQWQSVKLNVGGKEVPGIVVGQSVLLPMAGAHEFYIVYSLAPEQGTIDMIIQVLAVGTLIILILLTVTIIGVSYQLITPVRRAAVAASRFGEGDLSARLEVEGDNELSILASNFNKMAHSLQEQIANYETLADLQRRFVSDVSHELRTPLTTIRMAAEVLHDSKEDMGPVESRSAVILYEQVERFERMLADLLEISRIDANTALSTREDIDISQIAARVISDSEALAQANGVETIFETAGPAIAAIDSIRIERIIRNLYTNALEHAEARPVKVSVACSKTAVAVRVRDWGVGMTDQVAAHVFDRFYRADPARARTTGGTGLGLAIAAEDAHIHNGLLTVIGCPQAGSAFMLVVPVKADVPISELPLQISDPELDRARAEWSRTHPEDITLGSVAADNGEQTVELLSVDGTPSMYEADPENVSEGDYPEEQEERREDS